MKLTEESYLKLEEFFREILNEKEFRLPTIYIHAGRFSRILTSVLRIHGITIGKNIFVTPKFVSPAGNSRRNLQIEFAAHEIAHVLQFKREGFVRFFYKYLTSYLRNLQRGKTLDAAARQQAYLDIPFEIEARATAARFIEWNRK